MRLYSIVFSCNIPWACNECRIAQFKKLIAYCKLLQYSILQSPTNKPNVHWKTYSELESHLHTTSVELQLTGPKKVWRVKPNGAEAGARVWNAFETPPAFTQVKKNVEKDKAASLHIETIPKRPVCLGIESGPKCSNSISWGPVWWN